MRNLSATVSGDPRPMQVGREPLRTRISPGDEHEDNHDIPLRAGVLKSDGFPIPPHCLAACCHTDLSCPRGFAGHQSGMPGNVTSTREHFDERE